MLLNASVIQEACSVAAKRIDTRRSERTNLSPPYVDNSDKIYIHIAEVNCTLSTDNSYRTWQGRRSGREPSGTAWKKAPFGLHGPLNKYTPLWSALESGAGLSIKTN